MATAAYWAYWSGRLLWNFGLLRLHPFVVALGAEVLDTFDNSLFKLAYSSSAADAVRYNRFDKLADGSFYLAALVFTGYFFHQLTNWPRAVRWAIISLLALRLYAVNLIGALLLPEVTWLGVVVPSYGAALFEVYAALDFFRLLRRFTPLWHVVLCALTVAGKTVQEWLLRQPNHVYTLDPPSCDSVRHCFGVWWFAAAAFLLLAIWAGYTRLPTGDHIGVRHGIFTRK